ncbi:DegT/DnrJ/EryC1/StrS family aminotransferase [Amylibacter sp.]|nr:DegT/DnrJ/EryC1/StrS family aminotransferase [Amylibacter sp.]
MNNQWRFKGNELKYVSDVIASGEGSSTAGNYNSLFEVEFAKKCGAKYAVTFNSGTSTLHAALHALGVGYGDEVIMPPVTVISNFDVTIAANAIPVFADVDLETFNICPKDIEKRITPRTKAIMPVSVYGLSCDLGPIMEIAKKYNLVVINDAAEAHGATYQNKPISDYAHITSFSTENSKHIATGDGGIITTNDPELAKKCRKFCSLGYHAMTADSGKFRLIAKDELQDPNYKRHDSFAYNYRMPELAAAVGLAQTERYEYFVGTREKIGLRMHEIVSESNFMIPQKKIDGSRNTYWTFASRFIHPDVTWQEFRKKYMENGGESIYGCWALTYDEPIVAHGEYKYHNPPLYDELKYDRNSYPNAKLIQPQLMLFPVNYPSLDDAKFTIEALEKTLRYYK